VRQRIGREGTGVTEDETATQLYAVVEAGEAALDRLMAALAAAEIASVLIAPSPGGTLDAAAARPLVLAAQRQGVAALIADDAQLARTLRADGVHLGTTRDLAAAYEKARSIVGQGGLVGVDAGISRHDAMTVAEEGADYVAFGAPAYLKDRDKARDRRDELIGWWAEIFQAPCVALDVETPEEAETLCRVRADFIGVRLPAGTTPAGTRELVAAIVAALGASASAG
jgi:thiamine-phosphate pyrophosphorylase